MSKVTRFCFTWNNYEASTMEILEKFAAVHCKYLVYGKEHGENGTPHLQGFLILKKANRITGLRKLGLSCHMEPAKGNNDQAREYCLKEGDYVEFGKFQSQGKRTDLDAACALIKEGSTLRKVAEEFPSTYVKFNRGLAQLKLALESSYDHGATRGIWIWGPPGSGKSHSARELYPDAYLKAQSKWWDGYQGEHAVILDDLDIGALGHYLKIWADKYACTGETKGGTIHLQHRVFVITSNYHPSDLWEDAQQMQEAVSRRFKIVHKETKDQPVTNLLMSLDDEAPTDEYAQRWWVSTAKKDAIEKKKA